MPTDLELDMQAGAVEEGLTDLQMAIQAGAVKEGSQDAGTLPFVNRAIAGTFGAPVDLIAAGLNLIPGVDIQAPAGGAESITKGFEAVGAETAPVSQRPSTFREQVGQGIGEGVSMLIPFTKAVQLVGRTAGTTGRVARVLLEGVRKHPFITGVTELTAGAGTGTGRFAAEELDSPTAKPFLELGGSLVGGFAPTALTFTPAMIAGRAGKTMLRRVSLPFSEAGSKYRAGRFLKRQVTDVDKTIREATTETIGDLPPVVASGEKRLLALYRQFRDADPVTDEQAVKKLGHSVVQLEQNLRKQGWGSPEIVQNVTRKRVASIQLNMDKRVSDAVDIAQRKLDALPVAQQQSQESIIVRNELEKVRKEASNMVKEAWTRVPREVEVDFSGSKAAYTDLVADISQAEKGDIPTILKNSFVAKKKVKFPVNIKEMQGLRSKLLETQRISRKDGKWNTARIAGDMADSLLDDMAREGVDDELKIAIEATRKFKSRFERGIVGKVLGFAKTGAPSISPELTLDVSIGRSGIKGALDIEQIAITPEAITATRRYLGRSFTDYVTDKGTKNFNSVRAAKWIENNSEILDQFPDMRTQLQDISSAKQHADVTLARMTARRKRMESPQISMTARFLNLEPEQAIADVMSKKNSVKMTRDLMAKAAKDTTGEATEGLKGAYIDWFIQGASKGPSNEIGESTISGKTMLKLIGKNTGVVRQVFSPEETTRMRQIAQELVKLELAETTAGRMVKIELDDIASNTLRLISRVGGAQFGRWVARVTGGGTVQTPGIFSQRFKDFAQHLTKDRAFQLMHDAITIDDGGKLLKALLLPIDKPTTPKGILNLKELNTRVNLWLLGTGGRVLRDIELEQAEDQQVTQSGKPIIDLLEGPRITQ